MKKTPVNKLITGVFFSGVAGNTFIQNHKNEYFLKITRFSY